MSMNEFAQGLAGMDPVELALGAGLVGAFVILFVIGYIIWYLVSSIGYCKMFVKAGEAGWKAFIPYYKHYVRFGFSWNTKVFWPFLLSMLLLQYIPESEALHITLLNIVVIVVYLVLGIKLDIRVAKSFGKSAGWGVLLFFFPFIVSLILGFGKSEYIGNTTIRE